MHFSQWSAFVQKIAIVNLEFIISFHRNYQELVRKNTFLKKVNSKIVHIIGKK